MIVFPNAKINLGLRVLGKRPDGYHDISTVMVPVGWCDILEIVPSAGNGSFSLSGCALGGCPPEKNLVIKAIRALEADLGHTLPPLDIYLRKIIPDGAGLGGGSSDASFTLKAVNELLSLGISPDRLAAIAARIGAGSPVFRLAADSGWLRRRDCKTAGRSRFDTRGIRRNHARPPRRRRISHGCIGHASRHMGRRKHCAKRLSGFNIPAPTRH